MSQIYREMTDATVDLGTVICSCNLWICVEKTKILATARQAVECGDTDSGIKLFKNEGGNQSSRGKRKRFTFNNL